MGPPPTGRVVDRCRAGSADRSRTLESHLAAPGQGVPGRHPTRTVLSDLATVCRLTPSLSATCCWVHPARSRMSFRFAGLGNGAEYSPARSRSAVRTMAFATGSFMWSRSRSRPWSSQGRPHFEQRPKSFQGADRHSIGEQIMGGKHSWLRGSATNPVQGNA